ncbi:MAG TPA: hypothetical protein VEQ59_14290 [Polyangiaceae bacterium]|nr:hypothetical protein [Polyangiaceae bacterium]
MANGPMPFAALGALLLACAGCSSDHDEKPALAAGAPAAGGDAAPPTAGRSGASAAGTSNQGERGGAGGVGTSGGAGSLAGDAGAATMGASSSGPPATVDGRSIYALECHGDSKDCALATTPCLGVSSQTPNVAAGWACANRCVSNADCSDAPSGAEAQARCVALASTGHCLLVCQDESQSFPCPDGMACYAPPKSALAYCLWR